MNIILKGGTQKQFDGKVSVLEVAKSISDGLARNACAGIINNDIVDLRTVVNDDCELSILTFDDKEGKHAFNHTASHIMAQAVKRLWPNVKLAIGPSIDNGFYYDFDRETPFLPEELEKIEAEIKKIVKEDLEITRYTLPRDEAIDLMEKSGEPYKVELIRDLPEDAEISFYKQGEFTDLCAGPHVMSTKYIKAVKLTSVAGAYWRGSEKNKMLSRIYGIAFPKASELTAYLNMIEEAKKRDHRKLGKELELFTLLDEGPGFPFFFPKGMVLKNTLIDFWRDIHKKAGYHEISTPIILNKQLWLNSGHWDHYKDNMYTTAIDEAEYAVKPMNCPGAMLIYKQTPHSYKEFPIKHAELGLVHRHEKSGALHGLMRVRCFTQDDAHIFMLPEQIKDEIKKVYELIDKVYSKFGFTYHVELSTRPENSMGSDEQWNMAIESLRAVLEESNVKYIINEGDGAFYGPKIDFHLNDSLGRTWQCGTIQLDFQMPEKFNLEYVDKDSTKKHPIMIHRVSFGSIERFIGILIEHYAGAFPLWISPLQVRVLPISEKYHDKANEIQELIDNAGFKVETDTRAEKIGYKIREAQLQKVNYMLVVGEKEVESNTVSVRSREKGDIGSMNITDFLNMLNQELKGTAN